MRKRRVQTQTETKQEDSVKIMAMSLLDDTLRQAMVKAEKITAHKDKH